MSPAGDVRPGWRIVLDTFIAAPNAELTNIELGNIIGVQAFRSRISDLRRLGCTITQGEYVRQGVYRYRLVTYPPALTAGPSPERPKPEEPARERVVSAQDAAAEAPQLFAEPEPVGHDDRWA